MADRWYSAGYNGSANTGKNLKLHIYTINKDLNNNTTTERADLYMSVTNTTGNWYNNYGSLAGIDINGNGTNKNIKWDARTTGDKVLISSFDTIIQHELDGTKSIWVSALHYTDVGLGNANIGESYICDKIARQANVEEASNFTDEENPKIWFNNSGGFALDAKLEVNGDSQFITRIDIPNASPYVFNLTEQERTKLRNACPNSKILDVRMTIFTKLNGVQTWYSYLDRKMTIVNANPIFTNFNFADNNTTTIQLTGNNQKLIKGYSNVIATVSAANKAQANKGSNMSKYRLQIGEKQTDASFSATSDVTMSINKVDSNVIRMYAIDSRGNSINKDLSPTEFIKFTPCIIKELNVERNNGGVGTNVTLNYKGEFWNNNFGAIQNTIVKATYKYKKTNSDTWINGTTNIIPEISNNGFSKITTIAGDLGANGFDVNCSYNIEITVQDKLTLFTQNILLGTGKPAIAISRDGVSFGAAYNEDSNFCIQINGKDLYEVGDVLITSNNRNPSLKFGGTWVLDCIGQTIVGVDTTQSEFNKPGQTGGEKSHMLTINEIPSHTHSLYGAVNVANPHSHNKGETISFGTETAKTYDWNSVVTYTGGSKSHNNLQPYKTFYIWKRTA